MNTLLRFLFLFAFSVTAQAGTGAQALEAFLKGLYSLEAVYIQSLVDAKGQIIEETGGTMWISRPGRFRFEYTTPYEQLYVADGDKIWFYDPDLEQVTVRDQAAALTNTPAAFLSSKQPVTEAFEIEELGHHAELDWLELKPKVAQENFEFLRLAMDGKVLRAMEMVDGFGQTTRLYFRTVSRNPDISSAQFNFAPPPGVDVVGDQEESR